MKKNNVLKAIEICRNGDHNKTREILIDMLQSESIGLILSKTKVSNEQDALSIFYDAIMDQVDEMISGKFNFINELKFISYFKNKCILKAKEFIRENISPFIPLPDIALENEEIIEDEFNEIRTQDYNRKNELYGIDLMPDLEKTGLPIEVMKAFYFLSDKCKILIVLRKIMNISHKKIVDSVGILYTIGNENVCKNTLKRCWKLLITKSKKQRK